MKLLLIRPHSRTAILFSKYIAVSLFAIAMLSLLVMCGYTANALFYGFGSIHTADLFLNQQGQIVQQNVMMQAIKMYGLSIFPVIGYATLAFAVSTVLRNSALAVGSSLFIMIANVRRDRSCMLLRPFFTSCLFPSVCTCCQNTFFWSLVSIIICTDSLNRSACTISRSRRNFRLSCRSTSSVMSISHWYVARAFSSAAMSS